MMETNLMHNVIRALRYGTVIALLGLSTAPMDARAGLRNAASRNSQGGAAVSRSDTSQNVQPLPGAGQCLLPDGRLLFVGGQGVRGSVTTAAIKDPRTGAVALLTAGLTHARAGASATVLPDGSVLVFGGAGADGALVSAAEVLDPATLTFRDLPPVTLAPRANHTATLLTNGQVLFAGGVGASGRPLGTVQLWDFATGQATTLAVELKSARSSHTASLLADGSVLLWGGVDAHDRPLTYGEVVDLRIPAVRIEPSAIQAANDVRSPLLEESNPQNGATGVPVNVLIALRFSKPLRMETINTDSVTLSTSEGAVAVKVVPAEGGMLAFVTPQAALAPGTAYTLSVSGAADNAVQPLPGLNLLFTTQGDNDTANSQDASGDPMNSPSRKLPPLQAPAGETALAGQSLMLNGKPLPRVLVEIDSLHAYTDGTGRFLLRNVAPGHHVMIIDGTPAARGGKLYGIYRVGVDIQGGRTNVLGYTNWMTALDTKHVIHIPSPTTSDLVIANPDVPGLELDIPAGTVIRDARGQVVTEIGITPIPIGQPPFPLKTGVVFPVYFTIQPGGTTFSTAGQTWSASATSQAKGARIHYRNYRNAKPGARFNFWNYDPTQKGWYVYGKGRVRNDRSMIDPEPGVQIWAFDGAMVSDPGNAPSTGPKPCNPCDGDPVDLQTGLFVYRHTDLVLQDVIPIELTRVYRPNDFTSRAFGIGTSMPYDIFNVGDNNGNVGPWGGDIEGYTYQDLILADGGRVHFTRTSPCDPSGYCDYPWATYAATSTPDDFYGSTLRQAGDSVPGSFWLLTKKDGTVYEFRDSDASVHARYAAILGIHDRYGNALTFTRDAHGNLLKVTSPNGRWIQLTYDTLDRVTQAQDNIGRTVSYVYDTAGRLSTVTDANGGLTTYTYDSDNNMLTITNPRRITYLTNTYDANGRVSTQTHADGAVYSYNYTLDATGNVSQTTMTDPLGYVRQVTFNQDGYMTSDTRALGKPEQQTSTYNRQPGSGLVLSLTDSFSRQTAYTYDAMGNMTSVTRLAGTSKASSTTFTFEPLYSSLASMTDSLGHATTYQYDNKGNLTSVTNSLGDAMTMSYNPDGQVTTIADPLGNTTGFSYDHGDLSEITDPLGRTATKFVDAAGRLTSLRDPLGNTTTYAYTPLNQVSTITDALQTQIVNVYDPDGSLLTLTDANQHTTTYTYDNMDRVLTKQDPLEHSESYQYDLAGNRVQTIDRRGSVTLYAYDGLNRTTFVGFGMRPGPTYESTITYVYDAASHSTQIIDSAAGTLTATFDDLDRLVTEATPQGTVSYTYDSGVRRKTMTVSGQAPLSYSYDDADRLTAIAQGDVAVSFAYDSAGRRTSVVLPNRVTAAYLYDPASQAASITYHVGGSMLCDAAYAYDQAGRRSALSGSLARIDLPSPVGTAAYNAANQLTEWGPMTFGYDENGNTVMEGSRSLAWNSRNQLVSVGGTAFGYDGRGRRMAHVVSGSTTNYLYDGANAVQELVGATASANLLTGLGVDELFMRTDAAGPRVVLADAQNSSVALLDSSGAVRTSYTYEPFGKTTAAGESSTNNNGFTGRESDPTGLYYYRARYYDPETGRFLSEDPLAFRSGTANFYAYVGDDPVNGLDPSGLRTQVCCRPLRGFLGRLSGKNHCYVLITSDDDQLQFHTYGLHREDANNVKYPGGAQPVMDDPTDSGGTCKDVPDATPCKEKKFAEQSMSDTSCPSCGDNYNAFTKNSNYWVSKALADAGMTPPVFSGGSNAPGYHGK